MFQKALETFIESLCLLVGSLLLISSCEKYGMSQTHKISAATEETYNDYCISCLGTESNGSGAAVGLSSGMPRWGTLFDDEMGGLVRYIREFSRKWPTIYSEAFHCRSLKTKS